MQRHKTRLRPVVVASLICVFIYGFIFYRRDSPTSLHTINISNHEHHHLSLTADQCNSIFPGLTREIELAASQGPFDLEYDHGRVLNGRVQDGRLVILRDPGRRELSREMLQRQKASIHQLHQALVTAPEPLPNASFALSIHDKPIHTSFTYARPVSSDSPRHHFPMPHFSGWSWPLPFIGSLSSAAAAIADIEARTPFHTKDPRPVWRGTVWFNNGAGRYPRLRQDLLAAAGNTTWADVQKLHWETGAHNASNALRIEDFCQSRYIIHTDGVAYSGRLQFHQLCESVVLTPPLEWMQHTSHLIRPVCSSTLLGTKPYIPSSMNETWYQNHSPTESNLVFVSPDWSDLEDTVRWLEEHQDIAAGIARRQREMFAQKGYLSPAADACYWRALIRGWSEVAQPVGAEWEQKGIPFEEFVVLQDSETAVNP
ncbi:glycosyl transferase family 90-domain-containing protein [Thelonectria olida]|uniref:Glycosyl transferase family 90-domain-containing protein n=1 Tax=Thelonectria olida TaxID=1576542 RepID=A0A9P8W919_9HYPO|nr:glycosyl transferase family 90-domain-containing protein [Thelonectria olida]